MRIAILDAATLGDDLSLDVFAELGETTVYAGTRPDQVVERIQETDVVILNKVKLHAEVLKGAKHLRLICVAATGYDNIDLAYCREHGIAVCNVVGYSTHSVAQVTLAMALSLMTHLPEYTESVRDLRYTNGGVANRLTPVYHEIMGKTWGIVGFGNIGQQVGRVAEAMGCRVLVNKRTPIDDWNCVDIDTICRESDILSIHTPLNASTKGLISRERIATMKPTAIVINVARGAVTDESALAEAIQEGRLGGLGVDVYEKEPLEKDHPYNKILSYPNACFTPHMAWGGYETRVRLVSEIAENIRAYLEGSRRNRVD